MAFYRCPINLSKGINGYGVEWDGNSGSAFTRTDLASGFSNPTPAVSNGSGSSPFDNIYPWSGMEIYEDTKVGTLVTIPKFYYKWTANDAKLKLQISGEQFDGSHISPAHADRNDNKGERDTVYLARFVKNQNTDKSQSGYVPYVGQRSSYRTTNCRQWDYRMLWTLRMLYLVEFADWNCQKTIGLGLANKEACGQTNNMQYHTGTTAANRTTRGHTQYRHIEDLWGSVYNWVDGIYLKDGDIYIIDNPSNFGVTGGTKIGEVSSLYGVVSSWEIPDVSGYEFALFPKTRISANTAADYETYICDRVDQPVSGTKALYTGGNTGTMAAAHYGGAGLFTTNFSKGDQESASDVGWRFMKLP